MTNRIPFTRASRMAALLALAGLLLTLAPARAASSVEIEARALVGGRYEVGGWVALSITLVNDGEPTEGYVSAETPGGAVRRYVEMPAGGRKVVALYVQPEAFQRAIELAYEEPNGTVRATVEVRVLEQSNDQVAIVGDGAGTLRPQLLGSDLASAPEPIVLAPVDIPERPEPLAGVSGMVWAGDSGALGEAQRRSLERWVADGGQLVVVGGADWQARTAAFAELLPMEDLAAVDGVSQAALAAWTGSAESPTAEATVVTGALRDDARALVTADDGSIIASMRRVGAGRVILIGADLATEEHRGWDGAPRLWGRLLPTDPVLDHFMGGGFPVQEEINNSLSQALNTLPSLEVPPAELLLAVIVAYILLIGPISYVVLRRLDRREMAWVTAPLLIVLFSAGSYGIGRSMKGSDVIVNQISLIRSAADTGTASVESYAGIYSPDRAAYDLRVDGDALMGRLTINGGQRLGGGASSDVVVEQGDPAHIRNLAIGVFGFEAVRAVGIIEHEPSLSIAWSSDGGDQTGTVTNTGETPITDVAWISPSGGEMIGDLEPGESTPFTVPGANFNGSPASDQVYGFGGFDSSNDEQRRIQMRRQVIDALVGYGGFGIVGPDLGTSSGRGPYLIGWRGGEGPLPVVFDGEEAQRYDTMVEVIAAQPPLPTGEIVVAPHQMTVDVIETTGDASAVGPGMIVLGDGSVTYSVALPLEAASMAVSDIEILVASDPSVMVDDAGAFGGGWPEGYTVEIRDPASGEWRMLGDLADTSRFEIRDPASAISTTGRLEVRVTGQLDPNFGQPNVFVSAAVTGVIDR